MLNKVNIVVRLRSLTIIIPLRRNTMTIVLISVVTLGWFLASTIGTCAYFANESTTKN